jgi:crotonobetainyl-CoA:carnitine CoA-transferase CaiB-like acyl-CoA transferase
MLPLEGITVVSLEQAVAAPLATRQLADLGARIITRAGLRTGRPSRRRSLPYSEASPLKKL